MQTKDRTVSFAVWPHLVTLEGPGPALASLIEQLYNDARLPRDQWSLANTNGIGRRAMVQRLRAHGPAARRVGVAALTLPISDEIERRARAAGVKAFGMHMPTAGGIGHRR